MTETPTDKPLSETLASIYDWRGWKPAEILNENRVTILRALAFWESANSIEPARPAESHPSAIREAVEACAKIADEQADAIKLPRDEIGDMISALSAALSEARGKVGEAERERDEANFALQASMQRTAYLEKTKLNFVEALEACKRGLEAWADKPHNAKWWQRIDGTPIPNDLLVNIAEIIAQTANADRAERDAALSELAKLRAEAEWRPIESAPRDGSWFLGCNFNSPMAWAPYEFVSWTQDYTGRWYYCEEDTSEDTECTHWHPLPSPPKDPAHD